MLHPINRAPVQMHNEDEEVGQSSLRKRYFSKLLGLPSEARPAKRPKEENVRSSKEEASDRSFIPNESEEESTEPPETATQDDTSYSLEIEISGSGTRDDPIRFPIWEGNVILSDYHGRLIELSDDEDEDVVNMDFTASFPNALKPSSSHLAHAEDAEEWSHRTTSLARTQRLPGSRKSASSIDGRTVQHTLPSMRLSPTLLSPSSPSPARTYASTEPTSTSPPTLSEKLVSRADWPVGSPDSLVKIDGNGLEDSDDDFMEELLSGCATSTKGGTRDACSASVTTTARTRGLWEQRAQEENLLFVTDTEDQSEDDECDCVIVLEKIKPASLSQPLWTIDIKREREEANDVREPNLSKETTASDIQGKQNPSDDLFYTARGGSTICSASKTQVPDVTSLGVPRAPVKLSEGINWNAPLPVSTRKRLFFDTYHELNRVHLEKVLRDYYSGTQGDLSVYRCWLYTGHRLPKPPSHTLRLTVRFRHNSRSEMLSLNILVVKMLVDGSLSKEHIDGIVNNSWHASHLCGNWTCLNTKHVVPEPGPINSNRNVCFRDVHGPCNHTPKCLKHLKLDKSLLRPGTDMTTSKNIRAA